MRKHIQIIILCILLIAVAGMGYWLGVSSAKSTIESETVTESFVPSEIDRMITTMEVNLLSPETMATIVNTIYDGEQEIVVATLAGKTITQREVAYSKCNNILLLAQAKFQYADDAEGWANAVAQYTLDEEEIIRNIARRRVVLQDADRRGVLWTKEEAIAYIQEREADLQKRADSGSDIASATLQSDRELYALLNMTKEEYNKTILAETIVYRESYREAVLAYYQEMEGKAGEQDVLYEAYIEKQLEKADLIIY